MGKASRMKMLPSHATKSKASRDHGATKPKPHGATKKPHPTKGKPHPVEETNVLERNMAKRAQLEAKRQDKVKQVPGKPHHLERDVSADEQQRIAQIEERLNELGNELAELR